MGNFEGVRASDYPEWKTEITNLLTFLFWIRSLQSFSDVGVN